MKIPQEFIPILFLLPLLFSVASCAVSQRITTDVPTSEGDHISFTNSAKEWWTDADPFVSESVVISNHSSPSKEEESVFIYSSVYEESPLPSEPEYSPEPSPLPTPTPTPTPTPSIPEKEPADDDLVLVKDCLSSVVIDLRYATENNFTGKVIYENFDCYLRYGTVKKLVAAAEELETKGVYLKIWDAYRPVWAQFKLWEICPDPTFVSNPNVGFSSHSRGNTVDITLVDKDGNELLMPSAFDEFSSSADRNYSDLTEEQRTNALLLEETLYRHGFRGYSKEWWHYTDLTDYPVVNE